MHLHSNGCRSLTGIACKPTHLAMAPVVEIRVGLQASLLHSVKEVVVQSIPVPRILHLDRAAYAVHALLEACKRAQACGYMQTACLMQLRLD